MVFTSAEIGFLSISLVLLTLTAVLWTLVHGGAGTWITFTTSFACILGFFYVDNWLAEQLHGKTVVIIVSISALLCITEIISDFSNESPLIKRPEYIRFVLIVMQRDASVLAQEMVRSMELGKNTAIFKFDRTYIPAGFISDFRSMLNEELLPHQLQLDIVEIFDDEVNDDFVRIPTRIMRETKTRREESQ